MDPKKIHEKLSKPVHLEELKQELKEKVTLPKETEPEPEEKADPTADPRSELEYPFHFKWEDGKGKVWEGNFVNKILTVGDRQLMGVYRARLSAGMPIDSLDDLTRSMNMILSHLTISLVQKPDWASDLMALLDYGLLQSLFEEVISHENFFRGYE